MHLNWSTLALQTINVLVLLWLLKRFLFRPVAEIVAARRQAAENLLTEAATARSNAQASEAELARRAASGASEAEALRAAARASAAAEGARLLAETEAEITRTRDAAAKAMRRDRARLRRELEADARHLAVVIAARLLARLPGTAATDAILAGLDHVIDALPAAQRDALAAGGTSFEVVSATALNESEQAACASVLTKRLGLASAPRFRVDPALLAGVELHGGAAVLRHSWQAELERIAQELSRDDADDAPVLA
jgi:F-type H+-transporting ATPase subunit b